VIDQLVIELDRKDIITLDEIELKFHEELKNENEHTKIRAFLHAGNDWYPRESYGSAIENYNNALQIQIQIHGEEHAEVGTTYNLLGTVI